MDLTSDQKRALKSILEWLGSSRQVFKLAGLSGTGKTFILSELYNLLGSLNRMVFIAPTGRASANLSM